MSQHDLISWVLTFIYNFCKTCSVHQKEERSECDNFKIDFINILKSSISRKNSVYPLVKVTRPLEPFFAPSRLFGQKRTEWPPFEKFEIFLTLNLENFFYHIVITRANYKLGRKLPKVWPDIEQTERLKFLNKTYFRISSKMVIFLRIEIFLS